LRRKSFVSKGGAILPGEIVTNRSRFLLTLRNVSCMVVTMYLRTTKRKYKDKTYTNYLLVESVTTPKGPRQRTVCSLGDLAPRPRAEWLKLVARVEDALVGQEDLLPAGDGEVEEVVRRVKARRETAAAEEKKEARATQGKGSGAGSEEEEVIRVRTSGVRTERSREAGPAHVGVHFWKRLELDRILAQAGLSPRACTLACAMVMNRLIHPDSEHAMPGWLCRTALGDLLGVDLETLSDEALYRTLDRLYPKRAAIEKALVAREQTLFNTDQTVFFYDLTSTYFEGDVPANKKAKWGYSRDKRPDCKQVVVGLVVNRDGFPMAHEIFAGNMRDPDSLTEMLDVLDARVGLHEGQLVVVDRGMALPENIAEFERRKLKYLVAARQSERDQWLAEFEDDEGFEDVFRQPSPSNPYQRKSTIRVKMKRVVRTPQNGGEPEEGTHILCHSEERVAKDRAIREKKEKQLVEDLEKLEARVRSGRLKDVIKIGVAMGRLKERYPRVARYYDMNYDEATGLLGWTVNQQRLEKARSLDGSYLLKTPRTDISAQDGWLVYSLLTRAENAFRCIKSPLAERPIFHHLERRTDTHIFLCLLAYHLLIAIEKTLLDQDVHTSWATVRDALTSHQISTVVLPTDTGEVLRIRRAGTPEQDHREYYALLGVPEDIIIPKKTWSHDETVSRYSD